MIRACDVKFGFPGYPLIIKDASFNVLPGTCCVLVGLNGTGKTTLLRLIAGKHMVQKGSINVLDNDAFVTNNQIQYLGSGWTREIAFSGYDVVFTADIAVKDFNRSLQEEYPKRRDMLVNLLSIDENWRMHRISDGQRRRVQLMLGLLRPFQLLLLDEITVDLDLLARQRLLDFLRAEVADRNASILYATHIFDGLEDWATDIFHISSNGTLSHHNIQALLDQERQFSLREVVLEWFIEDNSKPAPKNEQSCPVEDLKAYDRHWKTQ